MCIRDRYWSVLKSVLNYLNLLYEHELIEIDEDIQIKELLKEL